MGGATKEHMHSTCTYVCTQHLYVCSTQHLYVCVHMSTKQCVAEDPKSPTSDSPIRRLQAALRGTAKSLALWAPSGPASFSLFTTLWSTATL